MTGVNTIGADYLLNDETGINISFFEGYDKSLFDSDSSVCALSDDLTNLVEGGVLEISIKMKLPDKTVKFFDPELNPGVEEFDGIYILSIEGQREGSLYAVVVEPFWSYDIIKGETIIAEAELAVVGTISGASDAIYCPFRTANALGEGTEGFQPFTEQLCMTPADNRALSSFKQQAALSFPRVKPVYDSRPFAMTIYDSVFYETLEPIRQNIILVDVATPFLFALSVCVGFVASVLMARRRKSEFALMRCAGIRKWDIFFCSLAEQAILSFAGAALGCALIAAAWGYFSIEQPGVFLACYIIGTVFSSVRAAGTNVLKILHEKE